MDIEAWLLWVTTFICKIWVDKNKCFNRGGKKTVKKKVVHHISKLTWCESTNYLQYKKYWKITSHKYSSKQNCFSLLQGLFLLLLLFVCFEWVLLICRLMKFSLENAHQFLKICKQTIKYDHFLWHEFYSWKKCTLWSKIGRLWLKVI